MSSHCCEMMLYHATYKCGVHADPFDCPDRILLYSEERREYGLLVHDGGSTYIRIVFCPWCGSSLPVAEPTAPRVRRTPHVLATRH